MNASVIDVGSASRVIVKQHGKLYTLDLEKAKAGKLDALVPCLEPITSFELGDLFVFAGEGNEPQGYRRPVIIAGRMSSESSTDKMFFLLGELGFEQYLDLTKPMSYSEVLDWLNRHYMKKVGNLQGEVKALITEYQRRLLRPYGES